VDDLGSIFEEYHRTGDRRLRNQLIEAHMDLAEQIARRFGDRGEPVDDLVQVAQLGLLKAVERFDPAKGYKFSTFAEPTIAGEVKRHFRDHTWSVRVGRRAQELSQQARRAADDLSQQLGRTPRTAEVAAELGVTTDEVLAALDARSSYRASSLDATDADGGEPRRERVGATDPRLERVADRVAMEDFLASLPERERELIRLRFEENLTQSEIAARLGISQMHVSRLLRRTIGQLRNVVDVA
jgi:RNA polymerase sigma-B factor